MWFLKCKSNDSIFYIKTNSENIVGRNVGNLTFPNDKSVSRKHATIYLDSNNNVRIQDHGSKYGTYIDEGIQTKIKIDQNIQLPLAENSAIMFGVLGNEWSLTKQIYKTCLSTIKESDLSTVKSQLIELNVTISKEWSKDCTHLTMPSITLTLKVVLALVQNKPIVKPEFWTECLRCYNNNLQLPSPNSYLPDVNESSISQQASFNVNEKRKRLFVGKTFIFLSRQQMRNYGEIISSGGGETCYLGDKKVTHGQLSSPQSIVIQHTAGYKSSQETQELQGKIDNINKYMISKKKRIVPEVEIGLAILYVSVDKYCNPSFNFASVIMQETVSEVTETRKVLAPETQETTSTPSLPSLPNRYVNETLSSSITKDKINTLPSTPNNTHNTSTSKKQLTNVQTKKPHNIEEDNLFCFVQDEQPSTSKQKPEIFQLTLQSFKRKHQDVSCDDDDLFNFIPDTKKAKNVDDNLSTPQAEENSGNILNIGKNMKRKHDGSDTPDGKRINITKTNKTIKNIALCEKYSCQKNHTGVKDEKDFGTSEVISKLKELDILPAVVVVCNNLIVKKDHSKIGENVNNTSTRDGRKNFKKFVKIKPQRTCSRVINSNMLVEYQPKTNKPIPEQFLADSSGDEEDNFRSFNTFAKPHTSKGRSRRL